MGMAASQARYLALVARKSNCEYEGQQINQARLALSNQSANLFNQMLGLTVPVPPSTQDYTTTQYSFSDGNHTYVIDNWRQLPASDLQYNYIVDSHYFTDVYTGSMRRMVDPQVQIGGNGTGGIVPLSEIEALSAQLRVAEEVMNTKYALYQNTRTEQEAAIAALKAEAQTTSALRYHRLTDPAITSCTPPGAEWPDGVTLLAGETPLYVITYDSAENNAATDEQKDMLTQLKNLLDLGVITTSGMSADIHEANPSSQTIITDSSELVYNLETGLTDLQKDVLRSYGIATDSANPLNQFIVKRCDIQELQSTASVDTPGYLSGYGFKDQAHSYIVDPAADDPTYTYYPTSYEYIYKPTDSLDRIPEGQINICQDIIDAAREAYEAVKNDYEQKLAAYRNLAQPTYIGNSPLTYLDQLTEEQEIELHQVVSDMIAQGIDTDIINCFDENGVYQGGIYSFQIYGTTYYTTYNNLLDAYASNPDSNNYIDDQYRMPYYNASYINTRVDQHARALMETDSAGRFTSIRFENDSTPYVLHLETITDDEAYQDAMNQYYYENAKYDKMVQDINAKTSIIHQEDQQLELRLKQLDTEQNALKTEIDAVSKVVKDNVEASFKTFGG